MNTQVDEGKILKPDAFMKVNWNWSLTMLFGSILVNLFRAYLQK